MPEALGFNCRLFQLAKISCTSSKLRFSVCRNMITSGLGRFGLKQKQAMPFDHEKVIVFFIGGISIADIRAMNEAIGSTEDISMSFYCGGSCLLSPNDVLSRFLGH